MKILVMGGSYFLGKAFVEAAADWYEVTVYNRGNNPLNMDNVTQIKGDRHNANELSQLNQCEYEIIVDFCAYEEGDIKAILSSLKTIPKQYILISTVDVYERGLGHLLAEDAPFETRNFGSEAGGYILGKVALEKELQKCASDVMAYTVFRPAFLYGPDNYAPRESIYFNWIEQAGQILHPADATGEFQLVYVQDVVRAILSAIGNTAAYNQAYNLTGSRMETYDSFAEALENIYGKTFEKVEITVSTVYEKGIPLPFPLTEAESNWYDGTKALTLIGEYTSLGDGLVMTRRAYSAGE